MVAVFHTRPVFATFLTPGQRFQSSDSLNADLTVARLVTDRLGLLHVTLRDDNGHEVSAFAEQVEVAIAEGHLMPSVESLPPSLAC
ncbi:MAG TPA: hypothetical protein VD767_11100 [Thermomicrobiales bacterium]|nr:hypothetical protein [Thermomicrobiales bacterium]